MRLVESSLRRRSLVLGIYVVISAAAAPGLLLLRTDNSPGAFFSASAPSRELYDQFQDTFGRDSALRLVVSGQGVWTPAGLRWLADVERQASELFGVAGVAGLYTHHASHFPDWPRPAEEIRHRVLMDPFDREAGWVSSDASTVTVLLALYDLSPVQLAALLEALQEVASQAPPETEAWIAGLPVIQNRLDQLLVNFLKLYMPVLVLLLLAILVVILRSTSAVLPLFLLVGVCETAVLGAMGYSGVCLNMVVILLVPLLLVIALATAIHILLRFRRFRQTGAGREDSLRATYREKSWPVFWTGLTTAAAFGSLLMSPVTPVRDLGIWSALGLGLVTVASLTLYPTLLSLGRPGPQLIPVHFERWTRTAGKKCAEWAIRNRKKVFLLFAAGALVWIAGTARLNLQTSVLSYFRAEQREDWKIGRLESSGIGIVAAELILSSRGAAEPYFAGPAAMAQLEQFTKDLRSLPGVLGVVSAAQLLASQQVEKAGEVLGFPAPGTRTGGAERQAQAPRPALTQLLPFLLAADGHQARVSIQLPIGSFEDWDPVLERSRDLAEKHFPDLDLQVTGRFPLVLEAQRKTLQTMLSSMTVGLSLVTVIFCLFLGRAAVGFKALLPNLWPVLFVFGAMGWLQIPLDSTTVMIAAVALGLVVDDTVHSLGLFRILHTSTGATQASLTTLEATAGAHCLSSLLLSTGFAVCALSAFLPVARFGALSALAILAALAGDLLLLPALLANGERSSEMSTSQ